jgi:putative ABC transport system substrate-binding protein
MLLVVSSGMSPPAHAQSGGKTAQVGVLSLGSEGGGPTEGVRAFREALRELGWIEGQNVAVRIKFANLREERLAPLAAELVQEKVDVIVTIGTLAAAAARRATKTIPIVMAGAGDPVGGGLVKSLSRPEGNVTGVSLLLVELAGKRLELLKEVVPGFSRVGVLYAEAPSSLASVKQMQAIAPGLGLQFRTAVFRGIAAVPDQIAELRAGGAQALLVLPNPIVDEARAVIVDAAVKHRLPTMAAFREYVEAGGLMSYGADREFHHRRAARYVDLILKGAKPGELPIEQPTNVDLAINRKTATALGLTIPPSILLRADRVIE